MVPIDLVAVAGVVNIKGFVPQGWDEGCALCIASAKLSVSYNMMLYNAIQGVSKKGGPNLKSQHEVFWVHRFETPCITIHTNQALCKPLKNKFLAHKLLSLKFPGKDERK